MPPRSVLGAQAFEEPHDPVATVDRVERGDPLAAAVGVEHRILGEEPCQRRDVTLDTAARKASASARASVSLAA
jgi:hypothetical protein